MNTWCAGLVKSQVPFLLPVAALPTNPPKRKKVVKHRRTVEYVPNPFGLTPSEYSVMPLLVEGYSTNEIGAALGIRGKTVESHTHAVRKKMGARNNVHAAVLWDRWVRAHRGDVA